MAQPASTTHSFIQRSIERNLRQLPALPSAVMKVVNEANKPEPSALIVEEHVSSDQALTSKVLKVVNSAYYGLSGQVANVGQAVVILGMQQVRNLVLSVGCVSTFEASTPKQIETLKTFWLHAFSTAAATQIIGRQKRIDSKNLEIVFVGGLLHDIGRLFLFANFTSAYDQVIQRAIKLGISVEECERSVLGLDHAEVGLQMAQSWKLPEALADMIGHHEGPFHGGESPLTYTVHVADAMTKHLYFAPHYDFPFQLDPVAEEWLGLSEEACEALMADVAGKVEEATALYSLMAA